MGRTGGKGIDVTKPLPQHEDGLLGRQIDEYIEKCKEKNVAPILKEFCLENKLSYMTIVELKATRGPESELAKAVARLYHQREIYYERGTAEGTIPVRWTEFRLRQPCHGWTDKPKVADESAIESDDLTKALKAIANSMK